MEYQIKKYDIPLNLNVEIKTYYKENLAESELFEKNPQLVDIYPTRIEVIRKYKEIKQLADREKKAFTLIISENGFEIIENKTRNYDAKYQEEPTIKNSVQHFSFPSYDKFNIDIYYQGKKIDKEFLEQNPDLFKIYPTRLEVFKNIDTLLSDKSDRKFTIKITETTVEIEKNEKIK